MGSNILLTTIAKSIIMKKVLQKVKRKFEKKTNGIKEQAPLMEYLFVDISRLESYISQIKGAVKYDKVPTLGASISFAGPLVNYSRAKIPLKWTYHEMIIELVDYLEKSGKLDKERYGLDFIPTKNFCIESCTLRKVIIPQKKDKGLTLWISIGSEKKSYLYLIESYIGLPGGVDAEHVESMSGFSTLKYLFFHYGKKIPKSKLWDFDHSNEFGLHPLECFIKARALVSDPHHVKCLYRIRGMIFDTGGAVTFGYPIYIAESL